MTKHELRWPTRPGPVRPCSPLWFPSCGPEGELCEGRLNICSNCLSRGCSVRIHDGGRQRGHAEARRGLSRPRFFSATRLSPSVGRGSRGLHVHRHPVPPSAWLCWCRRSEPSAYLSSSNPGLWDLSGPRHNYPRCPLGPRLFLLLSLSVSLFSSHSFPLCSFSYSTILNHQLL